MKWFILAFTASAIISMSARANEVRFNEGEIRQAVVRNGFDISESETNLPVLISFNIKNKYFNKCHLFAKASPDFYRNKSYLYVNKIECNGHEMKYSAYVIDRNMNFGVPSLIKYYNSKKYLHVANGTLVNIVFTDFDETKDSSSQSG